MTRCRFFAGGIAIVVATRACRRRNAIGRYARKRQESSPSPSPTPTPQSQERTSIGEDIGLNFQLSN
jgi:hypothetical protein